jgi:hypothetical protein
LICIHSQSGSSKTQLHLSNITATDQAGTFTIQSAIIANQKIHKITGIAAIHFKLFILKLLLYLFFISEKSFFHQKKFSFIHTLFLELFC